MIHYRHASPHSDNDDTDTDEEAEAEWVTDDETEPVVEDSRSCTEPPPPPPGGVIEDENDALMASMGLPTTFTTKVGQPCNLYQ